MNCPYRPAATLGNRHSIRLPDYDYSLPGAYFVTLCTHERECCLGELTGGKVSLSPTGVVAETWWLQIPGRYPNARLDAHVIMPNHVHGIIFITGTEAMHEPPASAMDRRQMLLPKIVGYFKMNSAKQINGILGVAGRPVWQRNYYEHIITTDKEYDQIADYILSNPQNWQNDAERQNN